MLGHVSYPPAPPCKRVHFAEIVPCHRFAVSSDPSPCKPLITGVRRHSSWRALRIPPALAPTVFVPSVPQTRLHTIVYVDVDADKGDASVSLPDLRADISDNAVVEEDDETYAEEDGDEGANVVGDGDATSPPAFHEDDVVASLPAFSKDVGAGK